LEGASDIRTVPLLVVTCRGRVGTADRIIKALIAGQPSIHADPCLRHQNKIIINPLCIAPDSIPIIAKNLRSHLQHKP
jgi:hypothetical protein